MVLGLLLGASSLVACDQSTQTLAGSDRSIPESRSVQGQARLPIYVEDGKALGGTDPVAYFKEQRPVAGRPEFSHQWAGETWLFSTAENQSLFAANPEAYAPQYGGYCAWAVSQGSTAPSDPDAWKIVDGKLYLNLNRSVQKRWEKDIPGNIAKADANWPQVAL
ncbi:YHS domain-containing (seleno)protein [Lyngbya confervoides]|uniref:YHS domain-containing protein n=1 Tax=Lyngbya confervoides BDU141951 TaxID=1574623 RepID=A0ABD4T3Y9_9CYAN|nr:YHS domain-containing (seleno)protein [Lyngbya confervoides]MCM1983035.1 YHS domain-containing protein [Lyngbya confervoides BDU141951]